MLGATAPFESITSPYICSMSWHFTSALVVTLPAFICGAEILGAIFTVVRPHTLTTATSSNLIRSSSSTQGENYEPAARREMATRFDASDLEPRDLLLSI